VFEIVTTDGVVTSTNNALAEAMAELIAAEHRATESDLLAAVSMDLGDTAGHDATAAPTAAA
jgi:hypothetical protein